MTHEERLAILKDKLRARKGKSEYARSVKALEGEIAKVEAAIAARDAGDDA